MSRIFLLTFSCALAVVCALMALHCAAKAAAGPASDLMLLLAAANAMLAAISAIFFIFLRKML